jgi:hypothetical protein
MSTVKFCKDCRHVDMVEGRPWGYCRRPNGVHLDLVTGIETNKEIWHECGYERETAKGRCGYEARFFENRGE